MATKKRVPKKRTPKEKVEKSLSPEEATALSNIQSILSEILSMNQGEEVMVEEDEMEYVDEEVEKMEDDEDVEKAEDDEEVEKGLENTPGDTASADDSVEDRLIDSQTEQAEENVNAVAKAILSALQPKKVVKKSATSQTNEVLLEIAKIQKSSQEQMNDLSEAFGHIISGLGISNQLEVTKSKIKKKPITNSDNAEVLAMIQKALTISPGKTEKGKDFESNGQKVHKSFNDVNVLRGMIGK